RRADCRLVDGPERVQAPLAVDRRLQARGGAGDVDRVGLVGCVQGKAGETTEVEDRRAVASDSGGANAVGVAGGGILIVKDQEVGLPAAVGGQSGGEAA